MEKILLFSHSGFSDENANGITMKNLLSAWPPEEKAEFYCDVQPPDFSAAHSYYRLTDMELMKAFLGKKSRSVYEYQPEAERPEVMETKKHADGPKKIPKWLKKQKYNFLFKWARERLFAVPDTAMSCAVEAV